MSKVYSSQQALEMILNDANPCDSDGEEISLHLSSDSEISSDEEDSPSSEKRGRLETHEWLTETAKDGTVWREEQVGRPLHHSPIEGHVTDGEPTALARRKVTSRLQSFFCFITLEMLRTIQEWTVQHALQTQHENWFMAIPELMAFIAILLLRGIVRLPSLHDAWSANLGPPLINRIMARNRFKDIMQHLRFDDKDTCGSQGFSPAFDPRGPPGGEGTDSGINGHPPGPVGSLSFPDMDQQPPLGCQVTQASSGHGYPEVRLISNPVGREIISSEGVVPGRHSVSRRDGDGGRLPGQVGRCLAEAATPLRSQPTAPSGSLGRRPPARSGKTPLTQLATGVAPSFPPSALDPVNTTQGLRAGPQPAAGGSSVASPDVGLVIAGAGPLLND
ncbi:uncharacterized protein LOC114480851 [Gouania willdenowi]|uniref:uncharacterized protein LOC114480851 n=1 Tax=Gouania willdenowi TaxID=441366 RepID=UPI0010564CED|nr:uncharacterized protein LOC114480851 [Gouania willdenowi]